MTAQRSGERELAVKSVELALVRDVHAPALARAAVSEQLDGLKLSASTAQTLALLVSEVVTNAVLHSNAPLEEPVILSTETSEETVRVTVTDAGAGFTPRQRDPASINDGYGLFLLEKAATRWGVETGEGTSVWFELARES